MANSVTRHANGNLEIKLSLPWDQIAVATEAEITAAVAAAELPGFRKGKAPRSAVEPKLDRGQLYSKAVQKLLPDAYAALIKQEQLQPVLYPHIHIDKAEPNAPWEFTLTTCEAPAVVLTDFATDLAKLPKEPADTKLNRIMDFLRQRAALTLPDILVEEEANHRLTALAENLSQLGLSTDNYLQSKKLTPEDLRSKIASEARHDLATEFILAHIQKQQQLPDRQKTLDYLLSLV